MANAPAALHRHQHRACLLPQDHTGTHSTALARVGAALGKIIISPHTVLSPACIRPNLTIGCHLEYHSRFVPSDFLHAWRQQAGDTAPGLVADSESDSSGSVKCAPGGGCPLPLDEILSWGRYSPLGFSLARCAPAIAIPRVARCYVLSLHAGPNSLGRHVDSVISESVPSTSGCVCEDHSPVCVGCRPCTSVLAWVHKWCR